MPYWFKQKQRVPHQGYGVVACAVQCVDRLWLPWSAASLVKEEDTTDSDAERYRTCLLQLALCHLKAMQLRWWRLVRPAQLLRVANLVSATSYSGATGLAPGGQTQGAGRLFALPPALSSGKPQLAQRCNILYRHLATKL